MRIEKLEIVKNEGAGNLLFSRDLQSWISNLNASPRIIKNETSIHNTWIQEDINLIEHKAGGKELTIGTKQKNLCYEGILFFKDNNDDVHRKLCELDGSPMYYYGYTFLFNLGICLIDFHKYDGGQDDRVVSVFTSGAYDKYKEKAVILERSDW